MLRTLDLIVKVALAETLPVLELENRGGIHHQPSNVEEQGPDNGELRTIVLVRLVQVLIVKLNQLHTLILLQS